MITGVLAIWRTSGSQHSILSSLALTFYPVGRILWGRVSIHRKQLYQRPCPISSPPPSSPPPRPVPSPPIEQLAQQQKRQHHRQRQRQRPMALLASNPRTMPSLSFLLRTRRITASEKRLLKDRKGTEVASSRTQYRYRRRRRRRRPRR